MKNYLVIFGSGNPTAVTGLTPTFLVFKTTPGGTNATPPGITEIPTSTGLYYFTYGPTNSISFVIDGGSSLSSSAVRFIPGLLDPIDAVDESIGTTESSFGSTSTDPTTLYGYLKRAQEVSEGDASFDKSTSIWSVSSRGSSTLLFTKELDNTSSGVDKT